MASFDIIDCTSQSYRFLWDHRSYAIRLSTPVIVAKIAAFIAFVLIGIDENFLRQGLLLLPVYFLEGWVIAQLVLMALQVEHMPKKVPGVNDKQVSHPLLPSAQQMQRNIKASAVIYTLTKLALAFVIGTTMQGHPPDSATNPPEASGSMFIFVVALIAMMIWAFRFFWIYIPMLIGKTPLDYLLRFKAYSSSFYLLGVWMLCFVPMAILMLMMSEIMSIILSILSLQDNETVTHIGLSFIQGTVDYLLALLSSLAIGFGVFSVFNDENKTTPIW